jgi:hypothetical protein
MTLALIGANPVMMTSASAATAMISSGVLQRPRTRAQPAAWSMVPSTSGVSTPKSVMTALYMIGILDWVAG